MGGGCTPICTRDPNRYRLPPCPASHRFRFFQRQPTLANTINVLAGVPLKLWRRRRSGQRAAAGGGCTPGYTRDPNQYRPPMCPASRRFCFRQHQPTPADTINVVAGVSSTLWQRRRSGWRAAVSRGCAPGYTCTPNRYRPPPCPASCPFRFRRHQPTLADTINVLAGAPLAMWQRR